MTTALRTIQARREFDRQEALKAQNKKDQAARQFWSRQVKDFAYASETDPAAYDDIKLPSKESDLSPMEERQLAIALRADLATRGFDLTDAGLFKLACYVTVQKANNRQMDASALEKSFERLRALNCFSKHDLVFDAKKVTKRAEPAPEAEPSLDDLENPSLSLSTREGSAKGRQLARDLYYSNEFRNMYQQWKAHLERDYGFSPSEQHVKVVLDWFFRNGRNPTTPTNWDAARRYMIRVAQLWPDTMLTPEEKMADEIENTDLSRLDYDAQAALRNKLRSVQSIHGRNVVQYD